ncbi:peptide ABC transporter ATP-binding protein [Actinomycetospora sp. NBRC 106375]|uniref:DMT family transporter n=1 Tax=Actinomycetospora sp. NBRC 106375 TaxID=3032207 RepID=UPI0024A1A36A|nr:DMT family transporter [Actinomycetospora sp. NBRC 106375]GLZ47243.1 peptide ABC transporter ATP-binding protein [Actinomycetospora sp. NBRC 106375]
MLGETQVDDAAPSSTSIPPARWLVTLLSVLFVPTYASGFIAGKIATAHMAVPTVLLWRFLIALAALLVVVAWTRPALPRGRAWVHLAVTALLLQLGQFTFVYTGLASGVPAGVSSLILGMAPLLVGLLTPLVLATRLGAAPVVGLLLGACGVYIVLSDRLGGALGSAVVLPVLGMLSMAAGTLYQKRFNDDTPVATSVAVQMGTSLLVTVAVLPFLGVGWLPTDAAGWWVSLWLGIVNSACAFALMFLLLQWRSTVHVSSLLNLVPATTALAAVPILGEALTVHALIGLAVALVGMYVGLGLKRRRPA